MRPGSGCGVFDNFAITLASQWDGEFRSTFLAAKEELREAVWEPWMDRTELKFAVCLPESLARAALVARLTDPEGAQRVLEQPIRRVRMHGPPTT